MDKILQRLKSIKSKNVADLSNPTKRANVKQELNREINNTQIPINF